MKLNRDQVAARTAALAGRTESFCPVVNHGTAHALGCGRLAGHQAYAQTMSHDWGPLCWGVSMESKGLCLLVADGHDEHMFVRLDPWPQGDSAHFKIDATGATILPTVELVDTGEAWSPAVRFQTDAYSIEFREAPEAGLLVALARLLTTE